MSTAFKLSLPVDIPWRRLCVTDDMLDRRACDREIPNRWRSSIAIYTFDPEDEYQPYDDLVVTYVKVAVTITPLAPALDSSVIGALAPVVIVDELEDAYPCYGALLHVSVTPNNRSDTPLRDYPFIIDCEPKKRELYQMVTETGEVLSGSSASLSVGKGSVTTNTTENYNIDTGWNFGMQGSFAGTGGGHDVGATGQWGSMNSVGLENTNIRNADVSQERRERQSHVTQLSQMFNLFQAFHIGTNRALFFIEPRPHIRQVEASFVNGPRALEGMQEVFLAVVRKKGQKLCVGAVLETAHLSKEPVEEKKTKDELFTDFRLLAIAQNKDTDWGKTDFTSDPVSLSVDYTAPPGWIITGYDLIVLDERRVHTPATVTYTPSQLTMSGSVTWRFWEGKWKAGGGYRDHYEDGVYNVNVVVHLEEEEGRIVDYIRKLFLNARQLCCCEQRFFIPEGIVYETDLTAVGRTPVRRAAGSADISARDLMMEARAVSQEIHSAMIKSVSSARRREIGEVPFMKSDTFLTRVADVLRRHRVTRELPKAAIHSTVVPKEFQVLVEERVGEHMPLERLLTGDSATLGRALGIGSGAMRTLKERILTGITEKANRAEGIDPEKLVDEYPRTARPEPKDTDDYDGPGNNASGRGKTAD